MRIKGSSVGHMEHGQSGEVYSTAEVLHVEKNGLCESVTVGTHCHNTNEAQSTNSFKNRLDKFWSDMDA